MNELGPDNLPNSAPRDSRRVTTSNSPTVASREGARAVGPVLTPDAIPGCRLFEEIHRGAQGVVYRALQRATGREVAVKVMREGPFADEEDRARFDREVRILAQLKHPHIVTVHDAGVAADCHYFVMEYIPGQPLHEYMQERRPRVRDVLELFVRICDAVDAAHQKGIVHRDLKPGNILVDRDGVPHIVDFGLARSISPGEELLETTQPGRFLGTLVYAAPEQARGAAGELAPQTDVYALGVLLYEILGGARPYHFTGNLNQALFTITDSAPVPLRKQDARLHKDLETVLARCLSKDPAQRYATAGALARDLERHLGLWPLVGTPRRPLRRAGLWLGRVLQRNQRAGRLVLLLAVSLVVTGLVVIVDDALDDTRPRLEALFEERVFEHLRPALAERMRDQVCVIAVQSETNLDDVAAAAKLPAAELHAWKVALRAAHGALMEKLARARPAIVAWNIEFKGDSPYDDAFVAGVEALRAVGCETVVAAVRWSLTAEGLPELSKPILRACHWGHTAGKFPRHGAWRHPLVLLRGLEDPIPSLALVTHAVARAPASDARFDVRVDRAHRAVALAYWRPSPTQPRAKEPIPADVPPIRVSALVTELWADPRFGVSAGDRTAEFIVSLPSDAALRACTLDYATALTLNDEDARRAFEGKIVLIGDMRPADQYFAAPGGRRVWNTYGLAVALATLVDNNAFRLVGGMRWGGLNWLAAALGAVLGIALCRRVWLRLLVMLLAGALLVACALMLGWQARLLWHPAAALLALACATEFAARFYGLYRKRTNWDFVPKGVLP